MHPLPSALLSEPPAVAGGLYAEGVSDSSRWSADHRITDPVVSALLRPAATFSQTRRVSIPERGTTKSQVLRNLRIPHPEIIEVAFGGHKVLLDRDLAGLYGVETKALNQAVRRNHDRFPRDFMFQLTADEVVGLNRSQIVTGSQKHRDPRFRPYAFSEQGVAMLSSVLRSKQAVAVNIEIMRAVLIVTGEIRTTFPKLVNEEDSYLFTIYDSRFTILRVARGLHMCAILR